MDTQNQHAAIGQYLKKECRLIEPQLLEELTDHFLDRIKAATENGSSFDEAFTEAKSDFGGKEGVQKIQRSYRRQAMRFYARGTWQELTSFFQKPYLLRTLLLSALTTVFIFYYNLQLFGLGESDFWDGFICGGVGVAPLIILIFSLESKMETGSFALQARYWFTVILVTILMIPFGLGSLLIEHLASPFIQLLTTFCVLSTSLICMAYSRYSQRKLFPENAWLY